MKLLDRISGAANGGGSARPAPVSPPPSPAPSPTTLARLAGERDAAYGRQPVGWSQDLARVLGLPRRDLATTYGPADFATLEDRLRAPPATKCICASLGKRCPEHLLPVQRLALLEAARVGGGVFPIGVGHGKTLVDLLLPMVMGAKTAVLFIPANLRAQLLDVDWPFYGGHWTLPNLAGGRWFKAGLPVLHVITYPKLSNQDGTDLLTRIKPDLIICDEAHNLKARDASRTGRFLRYVEAHKPRLCVLSGTLATRSIKDYAHLSEHALGEGSPLPTRPHVVEEWATALDPAPVIAHPGQLRKISDALGQPDLPVRESYRAWRNLTPGVVATDESAVAMSLVIRKREPPPMPKELAEHIRNAHAGIRPDGEEFVEELQSVTCARQLSAGFFHRWRYPDIEGKPQDPEVIKRWFARRQEFNREMREHLKRPREHLDSPGLLVKAAIRAYQSPPYEGDKPVWPAQTWPGWSEIHRDVVHVTEAVWISDWLIQDAAAWAKRAKAPGIVWVEFPELGEKIARAAGVPFYGGGKEASEAILRENGRRSVVASIKAHGTGKNLVQWSRMLVVNPPADGATWEQLIGRLHRQGQQADEVEVELYQHAEDYRNAFSKAREYARFIQQTEGAPQKLLFASYEWACVD